MLPLYIIMNASVGIIKSDWKRFKYEIVAQNWNMKNLLRCERIFEYVQQGFRTQIDKRATFLFEISPAGHSL